MMQQNEIYWKEGQAEYNNGMSKYGWREYGQAEAAFKAAIKAIKQINPKTDEQWKLLADSYHWRVSAYEESINDSSSDEYKEGKKVNWQEVLDGYNSAITAIKNVKEKNDSYWKELAHLYGLQRDKLFESGKLTTQQNISLLDCQINALEKNNYKKDSVEVGRLYKDKAKELLQEAIASYKAAIDNYSNNPDRRSESLVHEKFFNEQIEEMQLKISTLKNFDENIRSSIKEKRAEENKKRTTEQISTGSPYLASDSPLQTKKQKTSNSNQAPEVDVNKNDESATFSNMTKQ